MIVKLVEVFLTNQPSQESKTGYSLKEVFINPKHVTFLREDDLYQAKLSAGLLPENLDKRQRFTRIHLERGEIVVVGDPDTIKERLNIDNRTLLKG